MPRWVLETWDFLKQVFGEFNKDDCMTNAAALAYYTVFSLAPTLVIVISVAGFFVSPQQASDALLEQFRGLIGVEGAEQIATMLEHARSDAAQGAVARVLGIVLVVIASTGLMIQLQAALNRAWDVKPNPKQGVRGFMLKRALSFAMIVSISFLLLVSLVLSAIVSAVTSRASYLLPDQLSEFTLQAVNAGISYVIIALLFAAIYKVLPDATIQWRDVAVGAAATALLFALGKFAIGLYLGNTNVGSAYGAASSLAILFVWVYYSSVILLFGAEFTQVWTRRYGSGLIPNKGAVIVTREEKILSPEAARVRDEDIRSPTAPSAK